LKSPNSKLFANNENFPLTETKLASVFELEAKGISHTVFVHPGPVETLEQAAEERGQSPEQVVRSLLFRLAEGEFALVLVAGSAQIPWKTLRLFFERRRLTMASREEVFQITGYKIGAVTPFGLSKPIPIYIDQSVLDQKELSIGSGRRGTAIILTSEQLNAALPDAIRMDLFSAR
jgi:Cys-tRNA(Pro) deacylase